LSRSKFHSKGERSIDNGNLFQILAPRVENTLDVIAPLIIHEENTKKNHKRVVFL
jgi:hypothetical protein